MLVLTNAPSREVADQMARALVEQKVAACVNVLGPCVSTYRWKGAIETAEEVPMLIKTTRARYPELEQAVQRLHPYEVPELIALSVSCGLPAYLAWVRRET